MKKNEIAECLDKVGMALANMHAKPQKGYKLSAKEIDALVMGALIGVAFGAVLTEGAYEPISPEWDAICIVECAVGELIERKERDRG